MRLISQMSDDDLAKLFVITCKQLANAKQALARGIVDNMLLDDIEEFEDTLEEIKHQLKRNTK